MTSIRQFYNFLIYDEYTKRPKYTRYNFDFYQYKIDYGLPVDLPKYDTFTDFFFRVGFDWSKPYVLPEQYVKYFGPVTDEMIYYIDYYGFSFHYGYLANVYPATFLSYGELRRAQCDIIWYSESEARRLQDYYYDDGAMIYTKYNFDFYNYRKDFNIYGNELTVFTDFTIRCVNLSGVVNTSATYGLPEQFKKYFYMVSRNDLIRYITYYGVNSVLTNDYRNLNNIDFARFLDVNPDLKPYVDPAYVKEFYIRTGQFTFYNIPFYYTPPTIYDILKASCCVVTTTEGENTSSGFLYQLPYDDSKFLVTCYHIISKSKNSLYLYADFQLNMPDTYISITTRAQFKIIGYDRRSDVLVAIFDPTLSYNIVNGITNLDKYPSIPLDIVTDITESSNVFTISNIGINNFLTLNFSKIVDNNYAGLLSEISRPPSYLVNKTLPKGSSGSPLFLQKSDGGISLIGMINSQIPDNHQYSIAINGYFLYNIIEVMAGNYYYYSSIYANDIVRFNNSIKYGYATVWLGIDGDYWSPQSKLEFKQLTNLNYTGGIIIRNFVLGFNSSTNERIYNAEDLNKKEIFVLNGPLLNSTIYKRFLSSGNVPIVLVSASYFDSFYSNYILRTFGKFSNQVAYSYMTYGCDSIGTYRTLPEYTNAVAYQYPQLTLTYYYYDGSNWILDTEVIGGNDDSWFTVYTDNYGNKFYQHKFEFPYILLDYVQYFMSQVDGLGDLVWNEKKDGSGISYSEGIFLSTMNPNAINDTTYPYIKKRVYNMGP